MRGDDGAGSGQVEWLDLEPPDGGAYGSDESGHARRRWPRWWPLVVAAGLGLVVVLAVHGGKTPSATPPPTHSSATPLTSSSTPAVPTPSGRAPAPKPVVVANVSRRLLGVTAGWEVIGRGPNVVVRIELAHGRITRTALPELGSNGSISLIAGPDRVLVRPWDFGPGYLIPDGRAAQELTGPLDRGGSVYPGPDPGHIWLEGGTRGSGAALVLVDLAGRSTGVSIPVPAEGVSMTPDGRGYLLFGGLGGAYEARPDGLRRVTTGAVLAVGPTRWLTVECDARYHCVTVVVDRPSGHRRVLRTRSLDPNFAPGVVSPDGRAAAVFRPDPSGSATTVHLLELDSGADRALPVAVGMSAGMDTLVWSPDGRWLFVVDTSGHVIVVDARTAIVRNLGAPLPPLTQLVIRPAAAG